jgi:hypothetical protein
MTCRCDTFTPAHTQDVCHECQHRLGECSRCRLPVWWTDLFQVQGTDGRVKELCADCVEVVE